MRKRGPMKKLLPIIFGLGILFLVLFVVINPSMGATVLVISVPFIFLCFYFLSQEKKARKELSDTVKSFQGEKEEILREIQRKEKNHQKHFEQLRDFGRSLSSILNKDDLMRLIIRSFTRFTASANGESQAFLLSHELGTEEFVYELGNNFDSTTLKSVRFNMNDELLNSVVKSKKISTYMSDIFGGDTQISYFLKDEKTTYLSQLSSLALIPLVLEDKVWGIIVVFCQEEAAVRIKNEEDFFLLLVAQASIALGSAIHRGLASVDRLTQLYNRAFLQKRLLEEMEFCNRQMLPMSLMMIDIDHFKEINDTYGHHEGDMVLKKIAHILSKSVRLTDICSRYGGEEFVVVLPGIAEKKNEKISIAERLRESVENSEFVIMGDKHLKLTISVGVVVREIPRDKAQTTEELINKADELMYQAKKSGRNRVCFSD